jgi:hypothetical protein
MSEDRIEAFTDKTFTIIGRPKPSDYVCTETEVISYAYLDKRLKDLEGEGLANAVAEHLKENPVEAGATKEEAAQIKQNKTDIATLDRTKLAASELPTAVNEALAQAKASGAFDGEPGKDGKDGADGQPGANGKDYVLTEADKQEIAQEAAGMVEVPEGGTVTDEQIASAVEDYMAENPVDVSDAVKTVNGIAPDENGDVKLTTLTTLSSNFAVAETANAPERLTIETHASGQNQPIHPKVLFLKNKFGGHYFWMAYTPYPYSADAQENPCIACSDDMVNWHTPEGVTNPLDSGTTVAYMSDTHLLYNEQTGLLEIWYRHVDTSARTETIYRRTSADGVSWNEREVMHISSGGISNIISPCVLFEDGIYKIWAGSGNPAGYLKYYESTDGTNWKLKATTNLYGWHFDVIHTNEGYEAFISDTQPGASVSYATSKDGVTWNDKVQLLGAGANGNWDSSRLYRTSAIKEDGIYYVFYTGVCDNVWGIGLSVSQTKNDVTSIKGYVSGTASVSENGKNYDSEIEELYALIAAMGERISILESTKWEVTGIVLNKTNLTLDEGETVQLTATITPDNTPSSMIAWKSNNDAVATVDGSGFVSAVGSGNCTIVCYAKADETIKAECSIKVAGEVNVLKGVGLHDGYVNYLTGAVVTGSMDVYSDLFTIAGNDAISIDFLSPAVQTGTNYPYKAVFYDAENGFVSSVYDNNPCVASTVPESATYCRVSSPKSGLYEINIHSSSNIADLSGALTNQYYNATDGVLKTENGLYCIKVPVEAGVKYIVRGCISGCVMAADNTWVSALTYDQSVPVRIVTADSDGFICVNYKVADAVSVYEPEDRIGHLTV